MGARVSVPRKLHVLSSACWIHLALAVKRNKSLAHWQNENDAVGQCYDNYLGLPGALLKVCLNLETSAAECGKIRVLRLQCSDCE